MKLTFMLMLISCVISQLAATCLRNRRPVPIFRWIKKTMRNTDLTIPEPDPVVKLLEPNGFSVSIKGCEFSFILISIRAFLKYSYKLNYAFSYPSTLSDVLS